MLCPNEHVDGKHRALLGFCAVFVHQVVHDHEHSAGCKRIGSFFYQHLVFRRIVDVDDGRHQYKVISLAEAVGMVIAGHGSDVGAVMVAVDVFLCYGDHFGQVEHDRLYCGILFDKGKGECPGTSAYIQRAFYPGKVKQGGEFLALAYTTGMHGGDKRFQPLRPPFVEVIFYVNGRSFSDDRGEGIPFSPEIGRVPETAQKGRGGGCQVFVGE